jgi:hypothetical protein
VTISIAIAVLASGMVFQICGTINQFLAAVVSNFETNQFQILQLISIF